MHLPPEALRAAFGVDSLDQLPDEVRHQLVKQVTEPLWRQGNLRYLLHGVHLQILDKLESQQRTSLQFYLNIHRRFGKSRLLLILAFQMCYRKPGARVLYLAPTGKDAQLITSDLAVQILEHCPADMKPEFSYQNREFRIRPLKGGPDSVIRVRGVNAEHADSLRGGAADLIALDECAQMDNLEYILKSVCLPMILTTNGKMILASTPPTTPGHDAANVFHKLANVGATATYTIREDVPHISREMKKIMLVEVGEKPERVDGILDGTFEPETTTAQRELFCRFVTDASLAVVPEYPSVRQEIIQPWPTPPHFDPYTAIDPGSKDNTGMLFGYPDFLKSKLIIEDESLMNNPTTQAIVRTIREKEEQLWPGREVYRRVSDVDLRLIQDLRTEHGLPIVAARKDDMMASVHQMRHLITTKRLIIHPRCVNLDRQLQNAIWNKRASDMERAGTNSIDGHFDLVAALRYFIRAIDWHHNPYPHGWTSVGAPGGPPAGSWVPLSQRTGRVSQGLLGSTPTAKRILSQKNQTRRKRPFGF